MSFLSNTGNKRGNAELENPTKEATLDTDTEAGYGDPLGIQFNADGTVLYSYHHSPQAFIKWNLNTAFDISDVSSYEIQTNTQSAHHDSSGLFSYKPGLYHGVDNTQKQYLYLTGKDNLNIYTDNSGDGSGQFDASVSADFINDTEIPTEYTIFITPDERLYVVQSGQGTGEIQEYSYSNLNLEDGNTTYQRKFTGFSNSGNAGEWGCSINFNKDGSTLYYVMGQAGGGDVEVFDLSTNWDLDTASFRETITLDANGGHLGNLVFNNKLNKVYHGTRKGSGVIRQYSL